MLISRLIVLLLSISFARVTFADGRDLPNCYDFGELNDFYIREPSKNVALYDQSSGYEFLAKRNKSNVRFVIRFLGKECTSQNSDHKDNLTRSPSIIIDQDYSSGRYYYHKEWEKSINGVNWHGRVAYSNFTVGDGVRNKINLFLICGSEDLLPCFELSVSTPSILRKSDIDWLLSLISEMRVISRDN